MDDIALQIDQIDRLVRVGEGCEEETIFSRQSGGLRRLR
jgi:hypothetical protein